MRRPYAPCSARATPRTRRAGTTRHNARVVRQRQCFQQACWVARGGVRARAPLARHRPPAAARPRDRSGRPSSEARRVSTTAPRALAQWGDARASKTPPSDRFFFLFIEFGRFGNNFAFIPDWFFSQCVGGTTVELSTYLKVVTTCFTKKKNTRHRYFLIYAKWRPNNDVGLDRQNACICAAFFQNSRSRRLGDGERTAARFFIVVFFLQSRRPSRRGGPLSPAPRNRRAWY